ncbi:MAG TPA: L-aspartate oxidase [Opitutaceae bacterium]|nr:L-aspartate oxidase [Opitutaceae bacterium]
MKSAYDIVVIGSGIAGLSFALKAAAAGRSVAILTKKNRADSNTNFAQGGLAAVMAAEDNFENHVRDTLVAGDGLCDEHAVREIVRDGPARVRELVEIGLEFSRDAKGQFDLGREGGHSHRRILHVKDMTGKAIEEALLRAVAGNTRIDLFEHLFAIDVVTSAKVDPATSVFGGNRVLGLHALDVREHRVVAINALVVMLATGGAGQVYLYTTNPEIATGDGIAMAYRAGVPVRNMEFIQFHPTTLYTSGGAGAVAGWPRFLISEAVRGEGAILRNFAGEAFMPRYHHQADLAPRDIVARAIDAEMKTSGTPHVWLDIRHKDEAWLRQRFPQIFAGCEKVGLNMARDLLPVVPAAHYTCGGVATDLTGATTLPGLYACGEVGCTGLHGANRLASNSLLEAIVVAHRAAAAVERYISEPRGVSVSVPEWQDLGGDNADERVVLTHSWEELRRAMWDYVGIVRTTKRLERARARLANLAKEVHEYYWHFAVDPQLLELRNLIVIGELIVACALQRRESRGLHFTLDFPEKLPEARDTETRRG